jgi:hypothetical protein
MKIIVRAQLVTDWGEVTEVDPNSTMSRSEIVRFVLAGWGVRQQGQPSGCRLW